MKLLVDTNLLLLLVVGSTARSYIGKHKRLSAYTLKDFDLLRGIVQPYSTLCFCRNVLTETSNLLRQSHGRIRDETNATLERLVARYTEEFVPSATAVTHSQFRLLGLTDSVLLLLGGWDVVLLTDDLDLYLAAIKTGAPVINFSHRREADIR